MTLKWVFLGVMPLIYWLENGVVSRSSQATDDDVKFGIERVEPLVCGSFQPIESGIDRHKFRSHLRASRTDFVINAI